MDAETRREWLAAAYLTLRDLPADLLTAGCKLARATCDHPSKIVPTIMGYAGDALKTRRRLAEPVDRRPVSPPSHQLEAPKYCTPAEAAAILKEYGIKSKYFGGAG